MLVEIKSQEKIDQINAKQLSNCDTNVYELLLIKAEKDVRNHIKVSKYIYIHHLIVRTRIEATYRRT